MVAGEQKLEVALPSVCRFEDADASEGEKGLWLSPLSLLQVSSDQNANCCKQEDRSVPSPFLHFPAAGAKTVHCSRT